MSQAHSISTHRRYGPARVCDIWGASRATVYRQRAPGNAANEARAPRRRGPEGVCGDSALPEHIQAIIEASPFSGEGYRKIWARLRHRGIRTAPRSGEADHEGKRPSGAAAARPAGRASP
jgi:hypothetical protein